MTKALDGGGPSPNGRALTTLVQSIAKAIKDQGDVLGALTLKQLIFALWLATPTWERHEAQRTLVGFGMVHEVPLRSLNHWKRHPSIAAAARLFADASLGGGAYDGQVWQNLIRRTAISDEAIRLYFQLTGRLAQPGGGVNVFTGPVDARTQGLTIPLNDAASYRRAMTVFEEVPDGEPEGG